MRNNFMCALACLVALSSFVYAEDDPPVLTNKDLKKYKKDTDSASRKMPRVAKQPSSSKHSNRDLSSYEAWCKKGTKQRNKTDRAKADVEDAESTLDATKQKSGGYRIYKRKTEADSRQSAAEKALEQAKKRLKDAEIDLADLEAEAHRKGIKPGWLRCQQ